MAVLEPTLFETSGVGDRCGLEEMLTLPLADPEMEAETGADAEI